eukprot:jgi/Tetstr1/438564/TSEL_027115.t1
MHPSEGHVGDIIEEWEAGEEEELPTRAEGKAALRAAAEEAGAERTAAGTGHRGRRGEKWAQLGRQLALGETHRWRRAWGQGGLL